VLTKGKGHAMHHLHQIQSKPTGEGRHWAREVSEKGFHVNMSRRILRNMLAKPTILSLGTPLAIQN